MLKQFSLPALYMGLLAAFVGYSSSFAIILAGLTAVGATDGQAVPGLFFSTLGMGLCSVWFALSTRTPAAVAWSTPGAAFFAAGTIPAAGFPEVVGAMIACAVLIILTGLVPLLGRAVAAIPKPIANAILAGVLLKLCLAPALALGEIPLLFLPVLAAWLVGMLVSRLAAMPFAVVAFAAVLAFAVEPTGPLATGPTSLLPDLEPIVPALSVQTMFSLALPLFLVTMAGQNIPGFAVLELHRYPVNRPRLLQRTGLMSLLIAPFGALPVNMSAITAAMMAGEDAGRDPAVRYWAAVVSGLGDVSLAFGAVLVGVLASRSPPLLITGVAGLALIPAFVSALSAAFSDAEQREAPALTFLIAASGMTLLGVDGAFWGIVVGAVVWIAKSTATRRTPKTD